MIGTLAAAKAAENLAPKGDKAKTIIVIVVIIVIGLLIFFSFKQISDFFKGIGEFFGLVRDEDEKKLDADIENRNEQANNANNPWSPQFYKSAPAGTTVTLVKSDFARKMADQIWNSVGTFWDTPTEATSAIKQMPTQAAVSFLAEIFNQTYNRDLWNWLVSKFDTDEQKKELTNMAHFVESLPKWSR